MLKQVSQFEAIIDGRSYKWLLESDSPIPHCKEAAFQFLKYIGKIEDNALAQQQVDQSERVEPIEACEVCQESSTLEA